MFTVAQENNNSICILFIPPWITLVKLKFHILVLVFNTYPLKLHKFYSAIQNICTATSLNYIWILNFLKRFFHETYQNSFYQFYYIFILTSQDPKVTFELLNSNILKVSYTFYQPKKVFKFIKAYFIIKKNVIKSFKIFV